MIDDRNQRLDELIEYHKAAAENFAARAADCRQPSPVQAANHGDVEKMIETTRDFLFGQQRRHEQWAEDINALRGVRTEEVQSG
jgi:hypothetical protein